MGQKKRSIHDLLKEDAVISSTIGNKLLALFKSSYNKAKQDCSKSKNKGGDRKYQDEKKEKHRRISKKNIENIKNVMPVMEITPPKSCIPSSSPYMLF